MASEFLFMDFNQISPLPQLKLSTLNLSQTYWQRMHQYLKEKEKKAIIIHDSNTWKYFWAFKETISTCSINFNLSFQIIVNDKTLRNWGKRI